ncbi:class C sortase [uncultured Eubacterium sp.]|uniref:class C sortase n=1 Tax=uncultured Eubacterium sp. TaxID=165185 RepID=UPI0025D16C77|nr:class C sortase [uncultured Eubacterium sp.]
MGKIRQAGMVVLIGLGVILMGYPWFSNWLYQHHVASSANVYEQYAAESGTSEITKQLETARRYNQELLNSRVMLTEPYCDISLPEDILYGDVLDPTKNGIMCFVEIPKINVSLPVYHGTSEEVLKKGVGHMEGSALPIGGVGNRPFLLAHTGMNTSRMFSDLTGLSEGDLFYIRVLNLCLTYRVCEIQTLLPEEADELYPDEERDLMTLVTCTPYGVNSHRLIVTGERISDAEVEKVDVPMQTADWNGSAWMRAYLKAILLGSAMMVGVIVAVKGLPALWKKGCKKC